MPGEKKVFPTIKLYAPADLRKKWFVYWYVGTKRQRRYGDINRYDTAKLRHDAAKKLITQLKAELRRLVTPTEEAVRAHIERHRTRWRASTVEHYASVANVFFDFLAGRGLTQALLEAFLQKVQDTRHPTTYNKYVVTLKRLLSGAGYDYFFEDIRKAKANSMPARYFQPHQAKLLLQRIDEQDPELGLFVRFLYYCFIRPRELRRMRVGDMLLEAGEIRVPGTASKNAKTQFVVIPKLFMPCLSSLYGRPPGEYIFPSPLDKSKQLSKNVMYRRHKRILDDLNFGDGYTLYSWKHTGAVMAAKAGISMKELQLQLRHHSLDETDKYLRQMGVKDLSNLQDRFPGI